MKYKSDTDIWWSDGSLYKTHLGIVECPHELPAQFERVEESIEHNSDSEIQGDDKAELIKMAVELGLGAESTLKRNSVETLKKKINEA